jgi:hypothetical protein
MGFRETINRNAGLAIGGAAVLIVIAVIVVLRAATAREEQAVPGATGLSYYTTDDGATWFTDRMDKIPPFKKDGKDAVRAYVYRDASGKEFVSHMERYTPEAVRALAALETMPPEQRGLEDPASLAGGLDGIEVKRPKDTTWVRGSEQRAQQIMQPRSPDGKRDGLQYVAPR